MAQSCDYAVYGATTWAAEWRDEQHLAHVLAKRHRLLYLDPAMTFMTPLRTGTRADRRDLARRRMRWEEGVALFRPLALPPLEHPRARALSRPLLRAQVRRAARRAGIERPIVLATGGLAELAGALNETFSVFHMLDWFQGGEGPLLAGHDPRAAAARDAANCDAADVICVVSPALRRSLAERGWESVVLRHGFDADLASLYDTADVPPRYAVLPRPILGYTGSIDGRLDFEMLGRLADRFAEGSLVLVGPVSPRLDRRLLDALMVRSNVHLIPSRSREELPAYVRHLDCGLLPYLHTEFMAHGAPAKFWEYLYAGAPIVGVGCPDLLHFPPPLAHLAEDAQHFPDVVDRALSLVDDRGREQRRAFALANSWDARADELEALVEERLGRSP